MKQKRYNVIFLSKDPPVDTNVIWASESNELFRYDNGWNKIIGSDNKPIVLENASYYNSGIVRIGDNITITGSNIISITKEDVINALNYTPAQETEDIERITEDDILDIFNTV